MPVDTLPAPRQSEPPRELDEGAKSNSNEEGGEETPTPSAPPPAPPPAPHTRQPKPPPPPSSRSTRSQAGEIPRMDYKKLNSKGSTTINFRLTPTVMPVDLLPQVFIASRKSPV